jgi:hypothetical protein
VGVHKGRARKSGEIPWIADYTDQDGVRHHSTFDRKKDADAFYLEVSHEKSRGIHIPKNKTCTVAEVGERWYKEAEVAGLETGTLNNYRQYLRNFIIPHLGNVC